MDNMEQYQQEYREALHQLKFSQGAKQRLAANLAEARRPASRTVRWPLGRALPVAVLCVLLTVTAAAAVRWQNAMRFVDSMEDAMDLAGNRPSGTAASAGTYAGGWEYRPPVEEISAWWADFEAHGAAESKGTDSDGWTEKRSYQEGGMVRTRYLGRCLSDFDGLWEHASWNMNWLEKNFLPIAGAQSAYTCLQDGKLREMELTGAYEGQKDAKFTVQYRWDSRVSYGDSYLVSSGLDSSEQYTTADGVEVAISTAKSEQGRELFWADYVSEHWAFHMTGQEVPLETVREMLDSLNLSALCAADG